MSSPKWGRGSGGEAHRATSVVLTPRRGVVPQVILFVIWIEADARSPWFAFPLLGWGMILAVHGLRLRDEDSRGDHDRARRARRTACRAGPTIRIARTSP
jgi:hypothetical protein